MTSSGMIFNRNSKCVALLDTIRRQRKPRPYADDPHRRQSADPRLFTFTFLGRRILERASRLSIGKMQSVTIDTSIDVRRVSGRPRTSPCPAPTSIIGQSMGRLYRWHEKKYAVDIEQGYLLAQKATGAPHVPHEVESGSCRGPPSKRLRGEPPPALPDDLRIFRKYVNIGKADKELLRKRDDLFDHRRLLSSIGNIPPAEAEAAYYAKVSEQEQAA